MVTKLRNIIVSTLMVFGLMALPIAVVSDVSLAAPVNEVCKGISGAGGGNACNNDARGNELGKFITQVINILLFIIGAVAVIMIIIGGIRFVTSNGDQSQVKAGRETILYAVIGLIIALMAYAIVNFVVARII